MRSKIIFVVLFMLSFTVAHDTVINMMHDKEHTSTSHYLSESTLSHECGDAIDEMHAMFHFEALVEASHNHFLQLPRVAALSQHLLQYTPPYKDSTYKPPIA